MIRVGRIIERKNPSFDGYKPIVVLTKSSAYGELSPYELADEKGRIMENLWQFSKVYENVPASVQTYSRFDSKIIWKWNSEIHVEEGEVNDKYWKWREAGENNPYAVRYPVGFNHRHNCLYSLCYSGTIDVNTEHYDKLDYIEARKRIYVPLYSDMVVKQPKFTTLVNLLRKGINLLIIEVDGPHQESLNYYKEKYNVGNDFIVDDTILINEGNLDIMLNDSKHPYGHGYVLASCLFDQLK